MAEVSVIIPTYNRRAYVQEAIDSVLAQTYTDFEIIVIDDGSTDGTGDALRRRYGDRVRYEWQENQGRGSARNDGAGYARGEFLCFLDDDDRFLPHKLESQVAYLRDHPNVDFVAGGLIRVNEEGLPLDKWPLWEGSPELSFEACIEDGCHMQFGAIMMRRPWFHRVGGIATDLLLVQDTDFFLRLLLAGCRMAWDRIYVAHYRVHANSTAGQIVLRAQCRHKMITEILSRTDVPQSVSTEADRIILISALHNAGSSYAAKDVIAARQFLHFATRIDAPIINGYAEEALLDGLLSSCGSNYSGRCYMTVAQALALASVDMEIPWLRRWRLIGTAAQKDFYWAWCNGDSGGVARSFLRASIRKPSWLLNIGTWSILLRSLWRGLGTAFQKELGASNKC